MQMPYPSYYHYIHPFKFFFGHLSTMAILEGKGKEFSRRMAKHVGYCAKLLGGVDRIIKAGLKLTLIKF